MLDSARNAWDWAAGLVAGNPDLALGLIVFLAVAALVF